MTETESKAVPAGWRRALTARNLFAWVASIYAVVVGVYVILRVLGRLGLPVLDTDPGMLGTWVGIGTSLMPALLVPALPLVILAFVWRLPWVAMALAPAGIAFVLLYGAMLLPQPARASSETPLGVYTHNLHVMTDGLDAVTEDIRNSGADVVALQELSEPAAAFLSAALSDIYPYQVLNPVGETTHGAGILSKWLLSDTQTWITSMVQMRTTVAWPGGALAFYALHPPPPHWFLRPFDSTDRTVAADEALRRIGEESLPVILAGDFNMTDQTSVYRQYINAGFQDAFREAGWGLGLTFADFGYLFRPLSLAPPFIRIDYVFGDSSFAPLSATVGAAAGSDHYSLRTEWALKP